MSQGAALVEAARPVVDRLRRARALRGGALGIGVGALIATAGGALPWLGLGLLGAAIGHRWPVDRRMALSRLDAAAELDGALRCAWDHRADGRAIVRAQQRQALAALDARRGEIADPPLYIRAAPAPALGWLLGPLLVILPLAMGSADGPAGASSADPGAGALVKQGDPSAPPVDPRDPRPAVSPSEPVEKDDPRAAAADAPDAAGAANDPAADAGVGRGDGGVGGALRAEGAAGRGVGETGGDPAGTRVVEARPGEGPALVLPAAAGDRAAGDGPAGRLVVGRTPPPPDAIADPARPYPSRYRRAIAAWFDRSRP